MNLYLISQTVNNDWDTYDAAVVVAETAEQAQAMHPSGNIRKDSWTNKAWTDPSNVNVRLLGTAMPDARAGVVLASFNAG